MANDGTAAGSTAKRTAIEIGGGALLGLALSSVGGPAVISWWYEPPSKDAFSCAGSVKSALSQFVMMQLTCAVIGAAAIAAVFFFGRRALAKRRSASTT